MNPHAYTDTPVTAEFINGDSLAVYSHLTAQAIFYVVGQVL